MSNIPTQKDADQVLRYSFDDATNSIRTTASFTGTISVDLDQASDSVAIGDGTNLIDINPDGSIKVTDNGGSLTVDAVSLPLPTGASTSALQTSGNSSLASIDSKLTNPLPVSVASIPLPPGAATEATLSAINTKIPASPAQEHVTAASPSSVRLSDGAAFYNATTPSDTQPISAVSLPLPTGAATSALQTSGNASLSSIDSKVPANLTVTSTRLLVDGSGVTQPISGSVSVTGSVAVTGGLTDAELRATAVPVSGTFFQATQPVSAASLPLPAGAATSALQTTGNTSLASIDSKLTNPLPVSGTVAATQSGTWDINNVTGTVSLPTGASTAANQATANASLASIDSKLTSPISVTGPLTDAQLRASAVPVSLASSPLPTGAATAALQTSGNSSLSSIDSKTPALGQALAAASVPVVLTAAQLSTLTPLTTVGLNAGSNTIGKVDQGIGGASAWKVDGSAVTQPVSAASLPLPAGAATSANQTTANTSLSSIDSKTPALGQALAAASVPVVLTASQLSTLTPLSTVAVTQSTSPWVVSGTVSANLNAGSNLIGSVKVTDGTNTAVVNANGSFTVAGVSAVGTAPVNPPVGVSGVDGGGLKRALLTDTSGRLEIDTIQSLPLPTGAATSANQTTANTSLSSINTNQTNGTQKTQLVDGTGAVNGPYQTITGTNYAPVVLAASATSGSAVVPRSIQIAGSDGTNARTISVETSGKVKITQYTPVAGTITQAAITVGTTAVRATVTGSAPNAARSVLVVCPDVASTAKFYVGASSVTNSGANRGMQLLGGDQVSFNNDAGDYYIISDTAGQTVYIMEQA